MKRIYLNSLLFVIAIAYSALAQAQDKKKAQMISTIAFASTRHDSTGHLSLDATQIYLMNENGTHIRRITENKFADNFPALSPDGKKIVFESNRLRAEGEPLNTSDLFIMSTDGTGQTLLIRGSSATWSPDSKKIAYHASASGTGLPIRPHPGAATRDNDIFVLNVNEVLNKSAKPKNITNSPMAIDDDPDWCPVGNKIVFTSHSVTDDDLNSVTAEIYMMNSDGSGKPERLTNNAEEERAPSWSPDGKRIAYMSRKGGSDFEICVMNADGTGQVQLTDNNVGDFTCSWSPDGKKIIFHRPDGKGTGRFQLWLINSDGTNEVQLTYPPGINGFPNWGKLLDTN
jgi:TolB protein